MEQSDYIDTLIKEIEGRIRNLEHETRRLKGLIKILKSKPVRKA